MVRPIPIGLERFASFASFLRGIQLGDLHLRAEGSGWKSATSSMAWRNVAAHLAEWNAGVSRDCWRI